MKVFIEKELGAEWGIDELVMSMEGESKEAIENAIIDLLMEDTVALLDGMQFRFVEDCRCKPNYTGVLSGTKWTVIV